MVIWAMAKKELRLMLRDRAGAALLVAMPLLFILILGLLLGEGFGQKPDDTLRLSIVDLDEGPGLRGQRWSHWVQTDMLETPGIRLEIVPSRAEAEALIREHKRAAVLVLRENFSARVAKCSFLDTSDTINPFHREGVHLDPRQLDLGVELLKDGHQLSAAAIIEQVVQVSMLRVILPYMIGEAFNQLSKPRFINRLGEEVRLPMPGEIPDLVTTGEKMLNDPRVRLARKFDPKLDATLKKLAEKLESFAPLAKRAQATVAVSAALGLRQPHGQPWNAVTAVAAAEDLTNRLKLNELIQLASGKDERRAAEFRGKVGDGVQKALERQFAKYNLTGMTWAALTKAQAGDGGAEPTQYVNQEGSGLLKRGAHRYQILVPAYTVMFAFFLVLTVGWVFVAERRQGTLKRLRVAPLTRGQILLGKLLPCFAMSIGQGVFLLVAGRLLFGMRWGPDQWSLAEQAGWLLLVVCSTSLAAMGLALLVAAVARSEIQVALFGAVPVLVLALVGGCILPREMMPEQTQRLSLLTPQGWALDAYRELLNATSGYTPNLNIVLKACGVLAGFGAGFLALAWGLLRLD